MTECHFAHHQLLSIQDLVGRLTLEEMVAQMSHGGANENGSASNF